VRTKPADQPLQEHLEYRRRDKAVEQANDRVVDVPEGPDPDLHDEKEADWHQRGE
jgi:hypothetical protein